MENMENTSKAYLQITLDVDESKRDEAAQVYSKYQEPF